MGITALLQDSTDQVKSVEGYEKFLCAQIVFGMPTLEKQNHSSRHPKSDQHVIGINFAICQITLCSHDCSTSYE